MTKRLFLAAVCCWQLLVPSLGSAQSRLTPAQLTTLKADILADATLNAQPNSPDGNSAIADAYNTAAAPDFWVWRSWVSRDELVARPSIDGTTFSWTGTGYITRSQGERDAFLAIFDARGNVNPSLTSVRTAFSDIFSGNTAPAPANRTHLLTVSRRKATRIEKLFATGTGSTASPALMAFEGTVTYVDVEAARGQ
jgi:hypothetical protein